MTNKKVLIFVETKAGVVSLISIIERLKDGVIVALDHESQTVLKQRNIKFKVEEDYITKLTYKNLEKEAMFFSKNWYKQIKSFFYYNNIDLGEVIYRDFTYFMVNVFRYIRLFNLILDNERPYKIIVSRNKRQKVNSIMVRDEENLTPKIMKIICEKRKIKLLEIKYKWIKRISIKDKFETLSKFLLANLQNSLYKLKIKSLKHKHKILMIAGLYQFGPIINELKRNKSNIIIRGGEFVGRSLFRKEDFYISLKFYKTRYVNLKFKKEAKRFCEHLSKINRNKIFTNSLVYKRLQIWSILQEKVSFLFLNYFLNLVKYIEVIKEMIHKKEIDILVLTNDVLPFEKSLVLITNKLRIPTLVVQHGLIGPNFLSFIPSCSSKMAIWGEFTKKWMLGHDVDKAKLVVTGTPVFDKYVNSKPNKKELIYRDLDIPKNKKIFLYVSDLTDKDAYLPNFHLSQKLREKIFVELFKIFKKFEDLHLIVKLHPTHKEKFLPEYLKKEIGIRNCSIVQHINLYDLLNASYALLTVWSTVGLEAIILNKPVIILNLNRFEDFLYYVRSGCTIPAYNSKEIEKAVNLVLKEKAKLRLNKNRNNFIFKHAYKQDGLASRRVAILIEKLVKNRKI